MKLFTILGLVCLMTFAEFSRGHKKPEDGSTPMQIMLDCQEKNGASDDYVQNFDYVVPKSRNESCFLACFEKKTGVMNENNKLNMEVVESMMNFNSTSIENAELLKEHLLGIYNTCNEKSSDEKDQCEAALKIYGCIIPKKLDMFEKMNVTIEEIRAVFNN